MASLYKLHVKNSLNKIFMKLHQISIFIENTKGRLAEVCNLLGDNGINIEPEPFAESPNWDFKSCVDKPQKQRNSKEHGLLPYALKL
jgi:hypothetical protein